MYKYIRCGCGAILQNDDSLTDQQVYDLFIAHCNRCHPQIYISQKMNHAIKKSKVGNTNIYFNW
jgi:cytochrome c peroxidase